MRDDLTGLVNRNLLIDRANQALLQAERYGRNLAILAIGLDSFKDLNNLHGEAVADDLLRLAAQCLVGCVRAGDTVARLGGGVFVVLLPEIQDADDVQFVAAKVAKSLEDPFAIDALSLRMSAGIGVARYPVDGLDMPALLHHAEQDLYRKKPLRLHSVTAS